jgi:signal transduction histidine kinase
MAERRAPIGVGLTLSAGVALALAWTFGCPFLLGVAAHGLHALLFFGGVAAALPAIALVPRRGLGARGAAAIGAGIAGGGAVVASLIALVEARALEPAPALALALACFGAALTVGLVAAIVGWQLVRATTPKEDPSATGGLPLRALIAVTCGCLAMSAWAIASGYVLGQRHADTRRHALAEARALAATAAERILVHRGDPLRQIDALTWLAPPGGWLVAVDEGGVLRAGAGVANGTRINVEEDASCRAGERTLPCAVRRLPDGTRIVAAAPRSAIGARTVLAFALIGLLVVAGALGIGLLLGAATARDLDRVAGTLDELRRGAKGQAIDLDRPIVIASLDEAGELAAALGRLRARLQPRITEYRHALERAQAADRARDEFLQLVSVELRSPLDEIVAAARSLLDSSSEPMTPEQREDVKTVVSAAHHLLELIDEVLDVSAIASGQVQLKLADVDLGKLLADVAKAQRPIVQGKGVEVRIDVAVPSPHVRGDERRLRQVITNIVSNAVKFTERGAIELAVRPADGKIELTVKDTGPGIAADQLPKLFREFVQLGSLKQRAHGTGLGLAICKRLVNAHQGEVTAESELGVGSTFRVVLPVAGPPPADAPEHDDTPVQPT